MLNVLHVLIISAHADRLLAVAKQQYNYDSVLNGLLILQ